MSNKSTSSKKSFSKAYIIDTNIILQDHEAIFNISQNSENLIIVTETVLQELDKFKIGGEDINFQARAFNRMLGDGNIINIINSDNYSGMLVEVFKNNISHNIFILKRIEKTDTVLINNDDIIINTGIQFIKSIFSKPNKFFEIRFGLHPDMDISKNQIKFISNDIMFRTKVFLLGYIAEPYLEEQYRSDLIFHREYYIDSLIPNKEYYTLDEFRRLNSIDKNTREPLNTSVMPQSHYSSITIWDSSGKPFFMTRVNSNRFRIINQKEHLNLFGMKPRNIEQRLLWEQLLNDQNNIVVIDGQAGTSKTLSALLCSLELVDKGFSAAYDGERKITYIRKTIISGDKQDEIGFLPGDINEKLAGYLYPLRDNIELIIKNKNKKKKKWSKEELEEAVLNFENNYNIEYEYSGFLRGRNLNGIIILDEAQNFSITDITTILSRITEGSKVFILGSTKQIDNPYLNKNNNALTFLLNQCGSFIEDEGIQIQGIKLHKVERGPIVKWIEKITK